MNLENYGTMLASGEKQSAGLVNNNYFISQLSPIHAHTAGHKYSLIET